AVVPRTARLVRLLAECSFPRHAEMGAADARGRAKDPGEALIYIPRFARSLRHLYETIRYAHSDADRTQRPQRTVHVRRRSRTHASCGRFSRKERYQTRRARNSFLAQHA